MQPRVLEQPFAGLGGTGDEQGNAIAVDASGNVLATGLFDDTADFDPSAGTSNLTTAGGFDIFVSKLNSAGNFVWARRLGGTGDIRTGQRHRGGCLG